MLEVLRGCGCNAIFQVLDRRGRRRCRKLLLRYTVLIHCACHELSVAVVLLQKLNRRGCYRRRQHALNRSLLDIRLSFGSFLDVAGSSACDLVGRGRLVAGTELR